MAWNDGLFGRQLKAARHIGTHARLLAGPGTGKTLTLTRRLVKLVTEDGVPPDNILAVAFTRINAHELRRSVADELAQYGVPMPRIGTLHSYALRQLLRNSELITSVPRPLRIADDFEENNIIRIDIAQMLGGLSSKQMREKFAELSSDWQSLAVEDPSYQPPDPRFMEAWERHRKVYGYTLRSELVWQLKHAVEENPDEFALEVPIEHLLVDEYQDLNKCDLEVIRMLAARGAEVFCAGDDDQSIYGFRRAHPAGIRRFLDEYQPSTPLELNICWRCDRALIAVGQYVANRDLDPLRLQKPLDPRADAGDGEAHLLCFPNEYEEAKGVASICKHLIDIEGYAPDDILVLLRSDHQRRYSSVLEAAIARSGLEVNVRAERGGPMEESPGRHLLCLMRLSVDKRDDLSWRTIFQLVGRRNGIGPKTISDMYDYADDNGLRFHQVLQRIEENPELILRGRFVQQEIVAVRELTAQLADLAEAELSDVQDEIERARAREELLVRLADFAEIIISSQEDRQVILAHVRKVAERADVATFGQLLDALVGPEDTLDQELEGGKINILTMHRAKGLSAKAVIIVAAEEQLIPGNAAGGAYDDERRLLYVSLTRAKHWLYVTYCNRRVGKRQQESGSDPGNPRRTLTPFLRGAIPVESGSQYVASLSARRQQRIASYG